MSASEKDILNDHLTIYQNGLLNETMPFWFPRSVDETYGGFVNSLGRDGTILQTNKYVWFQGRSLWTLCNLYNSVEKNESWLDYAKKGADFIDKYCFDENQRAFFYVTQDGRPLQKTENIFSDIYLILGKSAYAAACGDASAAEQTLTFFQKILQIVQKTVYTATEVSPRTLAVPMILIGAAQELRKTCPAPWLTAVIDDALDEIRRYLMNEEHSCVLEMAGPNGELIDSFNGRSVCTGHSFETAWFILEEARLRNNDSKLIRLGTTILDWTLNAAWDNQYGGLVQLRDCKNLPCSDYSHNMKLWWTHNEAIIATLLAWLLTSEPLYWRWYTQIHQWAYAHFHDTVFGEWFGYLHRDGAVSTDLKGNIWKGPFHLPRMQCYCWQRIRDELDK